MKINRTQFKAIVKECLIELLQEGLSNSLSVSNATDVHEQRNSRNRDLEPLPGQTRNNHSNNNKVDPAAVRRRTMDLIEHGRPQVSPIIHEAQRQRQAAVSQVVANAAPNALMAAIFADTANTTFASQESPGASVVGDSATKAAAAADPSSLFGEDKIDAWNRAAFAPSKPGLLHSPLAMDLLKGE
jgi:hypothetical protein